MNNFFKKMPSSKRINDAIQKNGFLIVENVIDKELIISLKSSLENAIEKEANWHKHKSYKDYGMVMVCAMYDKIFIDLLAHPSLMFPFHTMMGEGCIVYAYTSSSMPPKESNYSSRIHVDCPRLIPGYITNMACTIALDDFTENNGATFFLPSSQNVIKLPNQKNFYKNASRFLAPAGSVLFFNARLIHAGGINNSENWRHAITLNICRPWMKQRIDLPRLLMNNNLNIKKINPKALQKLGFQAQIPSSLEEYYAPIKYRKFTQLPE